MSSPCHWLQYETYILEKTQSGRGEIGGDRWGDWKDEEFRIYNRGQIYNLVGYVVLVWKSSNKWWTCVNFTDLKVACPKDTCMLPNIYWLIEGSSVYKTLSFMDAYLGYNQLKIDPLDKLETMLVSNNWNYYYNGIMPFGLKNTSITYKKLMDGVFSNQIGKT